MTDKTDDMPDSSDSRLKMDDLAQPNQELSAEEMEGVRGGDYVQGVYKDLLGRPASGGIAPIGGVAGGSTSTDRDGDSTRGDAVNDMYNDLLNRPKP